MYDQTPANVLNDTFPKHIQKECGFNGPPEGDPIDQYKSDEINTRGKAWIETDILLAVLACSSIPIAIREEGEDGEREALLPKIQEAQRAHA